MFDKKKLEALRAKYATAREIDVASRDLVSRFLGSRYFAARPQNLRPHFKTPKTPEVARRQLAAGAIGITAAKVGEAEVLARAGLGPILIANQVVGRTKIDRLFAAARAVEIIVAVESEFNIAQLEEGAKRAGASLGVIIEVDTGMHRCGTAAPAETVELARCIGRSSLRYRGVMGYEGHAVLIPDREQREATARAALLRHEAGQDLLPLYQAGRAVLQGKPIYQVHFFVYPPTAAVFSVPLTVFGFRPLVRLDVVLELVVDHGEVIRRWCGRRTCRKCGRVWHVAFDPPSVAGKCDECGGELFQRDDDREETIRHRLEVYQVQTQPLISYYADEGILLGIDATGPVDDVTERALVALRRFIR